jgi:hypothetical protein
MRALYTLDAWQIVTERVLIGSLLPPVNQIPYSVA